MAGPCVSTETMKTLKMVEAPARYGMTPARFEALLIKVGWITDGCPSEEAICNGYLTKERRITFRGSGFLDAYMWRR